MHEVPKILGGMIFSVTTVTESGCDVNESPLYIYFSNKNNNIYIGGFQILSVTGVVTADLQEVTLWVEIYV